MIEKLAEKYANSVPNAELIKYVYAAFPVYKVQLKVTLLQKKKIGIIEEFVLKLMNIPINNIDIISNILGIEENLVTDAIANLYKDDLINVRNNTPLINDKGRDTLKDAEMIVPQQVSFHFLIDGFTGKALPNKSSFTSQEVKDKNFHVLIPDKEQPTLQDISFSDISNLIKRHSKDNMDSTFQGDLISIDEIEKTYKMYKKRSLLVFIYKDNKIDVKIFDGYDREVDYENILLKMQESNINQIPFDIKNPILDNTNTQDKSLVNDKLIKDATVHLHTSKTNKFSTDTLTQLIASHEKALKHSEELPEEEIMSKTQEIKILKKQLEQLEEKNLKHSSNTRFIETYEHRTILLDSLKKAKKLVVILSPWIKFSGFDHELQNSIKIAIQKGIKVVIGYGIAEKDDSDPRAINIIKEMQKSRFGKNLILKKLGNTHEKVLLVDGIYTVITSFNWLSFQGNPNWGFRQESGIYTENQETINEIIQSINFRMDMKIESLI